MYIPYWSLPCCHLIDHWHPWHPPSNILWRHEGCVHRTDTHGDWPSQAAKEPAPWQWSHTIFCLSNPAWPQVHSLSQRPSQRSEALKHSAKHNVWFEGNECLIVMSCCYLVRVSCSRSVTLALHVLLTQRMTIRECWQSMWLHAGTEHQRSCSTQRHTSKPVSHDYYDHDCFEFHLGTSLSFQLTSGPSAAYLLSSFPTSPSFLASTVSYSTILAWQWCLLLYATTMVTEHVSSFIRFP